MSLIERKAEKRKKTIEEAVAIPLERLRLRIGRDFLTHPYIIQLQNLLSELSTDLRKCLEEPKECPNILRKYGRKIAP